MSFILDALKRAEEKRNTGSLPNVISPTVSVKEQPKLPWAWIIIAILLVVIVAGLWFRPDGTSAPSLTPKPSAAPVTQSAPVVAAKPIAPKQVPSPKLQPAPKVATNQAVQIHGQVRHETVRQDTPAPAPLAKQPAIEIHSPKPARVQPKVMAPPPEEPVTAIESAPQPEQPKYENLSDQDVPFRQGFPKFTINVHVSAEIPADRFILINLKRFNEGSRTPTGLMIEEITTDGVAITFHGRTVLVPTIGNP